MSKLLTIYLVVTGILAGAALVFPWLVVLGFFLFILPGYVLYFAPTAFLWGCIYAAAYWPVSRIVRRHIAALAALPMTALVLWAIPEPSARLATETLLRYHLDDVTPAVPIQPQGDIRIDQKYPNWDNANREKLGFRPYSCDDRCLALLFEPGVRSVTMTLTKTPTFETIRDGVTLLDDNSLTYRLQPKSHCGERGLDPDLEHRRGHFGRTRDDNQAMVAEWGLKLTDDYCLIGEAPLNGFDMLIRTGTWRQSTPEESKPSDWSLLNSETRADYHEIHNGEGVILFRRFNLETHALVAPLLIDGKGEGGGSLALRFGWATQTVSTKASGVGEEAMEGVDAALAVQRTFDPQNGLIAARRALRAVLADPSVAGGEAAPSLIGNYMEILLATEAGPEDMALVQDLLADPRIHDLPRSWALPRKLSASQLFQLLPAAIHMLATAPAAAGVDSSVLGEQLAGWPEGAFATPDQEMRNLLADPDRRRRATGLIARLSDMGASGAPIATEIMIWHIDAITGFNHDDPALSSEEKGSELQAHHATVNAGRIAMCRLGPLAAAQLSQMLDIEKRFASDGFARQDWDRMMVRLGKPLIEITKPKSMSGSDEDYRERLAEWLSHFDAEDSCD